MKGAILFSRLTEEERICRQDELNKFSNMYFICVVAFGTNVKSKPSKTRQLPVRTGQILKNSSPRNKRKPAAVYFLISPWNSAVVGRKRERERELDIPTQPHGHKNSSQPWNSSRAGLLYIGYVPREIYRGSYVFYCHIRTFGTPLLLIAATVRILPCYLNKGAFSLRTRRPLS